MSPDEPYRPNMGNAADDQEILGMTRPGAPARIEPHNAAGWRPPQGESGRSLLPPVDEDLARLLERAEKRLETGHVLSLRETRIIASRAAIRLLGSRRPAAVAAGVQALTRMNLERSREKELRRKRTKERKKPSVLGITNPFDRLRDRRMADSASRASPSPRLP